MENLRIFLNWVMHTPVAAVAISVSWAIILASLYDYVYDDDRPPHRRATRRHHGRSSDKLRPSGLNKSLKKAS